MALPFGITTIDLSITPEINLADEDGRLILRSHEDYNQFSPDSIRLWCHRHARYGLPTKELVEWLRPHISDDAIEIGSGAGDLARFLAIRGTDNKMQQWPDIVAQYKVFKQAPIQYPNEVEEIDALSAIEKYHPKVVVASWVTQLSCQGPFTGNPFGVSEVEIVRAGIKYILIGNAMVHGPKHIMHLPHQEYPLPFLRSRASRPDQDRVWIWEPPK